MSVRALKGTTDSVNKHKHRISEKNTLILFLISFILLNMCIQAV